MDYTPVLFSPQSHRSIDGASSPKTYTVATHELEEQLVGLLACHLVWQNAVGIIVGDTCIYI